MKLSHLFTEMVNVSEAFDSEFDDIVWEKYNDNFMGTAHLDGEEFRLYIEPSTFVVNGKAKSWVNVAFARLINGQISQDLIQTGKNQSRQLGAIVNSLTKKLDKVITYDDMNAIVFIVEQGQEKRIPLYKRIMLSKVYGIRPWQYRFSVEWFGGTALVATKKILDDDEASELKKEINKRRKIIKWD